MCKNSNDIFLMLEGKAYPLSSSHNGMKGCKTAGYWLVSTTQCDGGQVHDKANALLSNLGWCLLRHEKSNGSSL